MHALGKGNYTGKVSEQIFVEDCILTNTFYTEEHNPDWHYHQNLHISFVYEGGKASTKKRTTYVEKGGSTFFYHSGEVHKWVSPKPLSKSLNLEVGNKFMQRFRLSEDGIKTALESSPNTNSLLLRIQNESLNPDKNESSVLSLVLELLTDFESLRFRNTPQWVIETKALLNDRWHESLSLISVATEVDVHPVTLSKNFRKYFHYSFSEYRNKIRIERSLDLVKNSEESLCEIANLCNFSDQSHFIRVFKKYTGLLPKDFRTY